MKNFFLGLIVCFLGFSLGRISHIFGGMSVSPHHWIYGLIIIVVGLVLPPKYSKWGYLTVFFGLGIFISDLSDFLHLRFYGADVVSKFTFWNVD